MYNLCVFIYNSWKEMEKSRYILAVVKITLLLSIMLLLFYKMKAWLVDLLPYCMILFCMLEVNIALSFNFLSCHKC